MTKRLKHVWSNTIKHRSNNWYTPLSKRGTCAYLLQTCLIRGCPNEQNIACQTREQKKCIKFLIECLMAFKFYETPPNTIKQHQARYPSDKMFGHQTMVIWFYQRDSKADVSSVRPSSERIKEFWVVCSLYITIIPWARVGYEVIK